MHRREYKEALRMKRKLAGLLAVVMSITLLAFSGVALAETWNSAETFTIKKGEKENIRIPGTYGVVNWATVSPGGVVRVEKAGADGIDIEAVNPGITTMTINSTSYDENGSVLFHTGTMKIQVTDADGNVIGTEEGVHSTTPAVNYRVEVGKTVTGATHSTISGTPTVSPAGIVTATSNRVNTSVDSTTAAALGISSTNGYAMTFTGVSPGTATVTYIYRDSGDTADQKATLTIQVVAAGSLAESSALKQNITLAMGSTSKLSQNYYYIGDVKSSSPSVVTGEATGTAGGMNVNIKALSAGTSNITFNYKLNNASEVMKAATITVTVRAQDSTTSSVADTSSGIYLTPRKSNATVGKSYRANVRINGDLQDKDADSWDDLVWISTNTGVATIDHSTGWFKIVGKGTTKIVCISKDGTMMDAVTVTGK